MFARVSNYETPLQHLDAAVEAFGQVIEEIRAAPGLHGAYVLMDRATGRTVTISFWDTRETMEASRVDASILRSDAVQSLGGVQLSVDEYDVVARSFGHAP
jgi:quinol monooxygenase YgiN